jgi:uncharacterized membrane protein
MIFPLIWYLQDILQVAVMGIFIVPDVFLLSILVAAMSRGGKEGQAKLIWGAFLGGLLWDLRWTNLPGLTAALNGAITAAVAVLWYKAPVQGRSVTLCAVFLAAAQACSGIVHYLFWNLNTQAAMRQFMVQQLLSVPLLVLLCFIFWKVENKNV